MNITIPAHVWEKHIHNKVNPKSTVYQQNTLRELGFEVMLELPKGEGDKTLNQLWVHPSGWFVYLEEDRFLNSGNKINVFGLEYNFFEKQFKPLTEDARKRRKKMVFSSNLDLVWMKDYSLVFGNFSSNDEELNARNFLDFIKHSQGIASLVPLEKIDPVLFTEMNEKLKNFNFKSGNEKFLNRGLQFNSRFRKRHPNIPLSEVFDTSGFCAWPEKMDRDEVYFIRRNHGFWEEIKSKILKLDEGKERFTEEERAELQDFFEGFRHTEHMSEWTLKIKESTAGINNLELLWSYFLHNTNNVLDCTHRFSELCEMLAQNAGQETMNQTLFREKDADNEKQMPMTLNAIATFSDLPEDVIDRPLETFFELMEKSDITQWSWQNQHYNPSGMLLQLVLLNLTKVTSFDNESQKKLVDILELLEKKNLWSVTEEIKTPFGKTHKENGVSFDFAGKSWKDLGGWLSEIEKKPADSLLNQVPFVIYLKNKVDQYIYQHNIKKVAEPTSKNIPSSDFRF